MWMLCASASANTLLVMGDSISAAYGLDKDAGWVALLERRLAKDGCNVRVVNQSVSGETTAGGAARLPRLLDEHAPGLVVIELGGNDGLRGLSPQAMQRNLERMIDASRARDAEVVLLGIEMPANYGAAYRKLFADVFARVAADRAVPLMPLFLAGVYDREDWMQDDGIHPTAAAQPRLLDNAWPLLEPWLARHCNADEPPPAP